MHFHVLLKWSFLFNRLDSIFLQSYIMESLEIKRWVIQKVLFILVSAIANLKYRYSWALQHFLSNLPPYSFNQPSPK